MRVDDFHELVRGCRMPARPQLSSSKNTRLNSCLVSEGGGSPRTRVPRARMWWQLKLGGATS